MYSGRDIVYCILTTSTTLYFYKRDSAPDTQGIKTSFELGTKLKSYDEQYRYNIFESIASKNILTMSGQAAGIGCFSSTVVNSINEFDSLFDYENFIIRMEKNEVVGLPELLGAKYYVSKEKSGNIIDKILVDDKIYYIIEKSACPIGYKVDSYIYESELKSIEKSKRGIALLSSVVINQEDENKIKKIIDKTEITSIDFGKPIDEYVSANVELAVTEFDRSSKGFTCKSNYNSDSLIYFTVPYDSGWTAIVDGKETNIISSGGMMLLPVSAGNHNIEFVYHTPGFKLGTIISIVSITAYVAWILAEVVYKKRKDKLVNKTDKGE